MQRSLKNFFPAKMAAVSPSIVSVDLNENGHIAESVNGFDRDLVGK